MCCPLLLHLIIFGLVLKMFLGTLSSSRTQVVGWLVGWSVSLSVGLSVSLLGTFVKKKVTSRVWNQTETYLRPIYQHTYLLTYLCQSSKSSGSRDSTVVTLMKVELNLQQNLNAEILNNNNIYIKKKNIIAQKNLLTLFLTKKSDQNVLHKVFFGQSQYFDKIKFAKKKV